MIPRLGSHHTCTPRAKKANLVHTTYPDCIYIPPYRKATWFILENWSKQDGEIWVIRKIGTLGKKES